MVFVFCLISSYLVLVSIFSLTEFLNLSLLHSLFIFQLLSEHLSLAGMVLRDGEPRTGEIAQWQGTWLLCPRFWVQCPALQMNKYTVKISSQIFMGNHTLRQTIQAKCVTIPFLIPIAGVFYGLPSSLLSFLFLSYFFFSSFVYSDSLSLVSL